MKLEVHGQSATLLPQYALHLNDLNILALADFHIGKVDSISKHPTQAWLPQELNKEDLGRILRLVKEVQPESLYIISELISDIKNLTPQLIDEVREWRRELDCAVVILESHHDRKIQHHLQEWNIVVAQSMTVDNFLFSHGLSKPDKPGQIVVSGHMNPIVVVQTDQEELRLPCFAWEEPHLILPSFGSSLNGTEIQRQPTGRYFSVAGGEVVEI